MSCTEMIYFKNDGYPEKLKDIKNSRDGAIAIWRILENKYLPPFRPSIVPTGIPDNKIEEYLTYKPSRTMPLLCNNTSNINEIYDLYKSDRVNRIDKIVLGTTFKKVLVKKENINELISAFKLFDGETSLKEQAKVLEGVLKDDEVIAIGWN